MDDAVHNEDLLLRYLDGELPTEEKKEVESRLQTDDAFRQRYTDLRVAVEAIRHLGTLQQVQGVHKEMMQELKGTSAEGNVFPIKKIIRYTLGIAASLALLFVGIRLYQNAQLSPGRLYNEAFVDFDVSATRGTQGNLTRIETLYQQKAYSNITGSMRTLHLSPKDSLLTGLSYLHQENFSSAIEWFRKLMNSGNDYRQDAEFYLALSYIKTEDYQRALSLMQSIYNDESHVYQQQISAELITKLRKLAHENTD